MLFSFKDELPNLDIPLGNRFFFFLQLLFAFSDFEQRTYSRYLKLFFWSTCHRSNTKAAFQQDSGPSLTMDGDPG